MTEKGTKIFTHLDANCPDCSWYRNGDVLWWLHSLMALTCTSFQCIRWGGNCRRELWAVAMLPKWKDSQGMEAWQPWFRALSRRLIVPHSRCQGGSSAWKPAQKCHKTKQKHFLSNSTTCKSPLPSSGNNTDVKTSASSSNDKIVHSGKWKKPQKELLPQAWVPSAKTGMLLNASPAAADADSNWIFFTHTLKPLSRTLACQKMAGQLTTAQFLWLSWFTP